MQGENTAVMLGRKAQQPVRGLHADAGYFSDRTDPLFEFGWGLEPGYPVQGHFMSGGRKNSPRLRPFLGNPQVQTVMGR
jgi:hypothetical protein